MFLKVFTYITLLLAAVTTTDVDSISEKVAEIDEIIDTQENKPELEEVTEIEQPKSILSETILSQEQSETTNSESVVGTVASKIVSEVESQIEENWVVTEGNTINGERELIIDDQLILSETIKDAEIVAQKDYYRDGTVANEIIYQDDSKFIYSYDQKGTLIDSKEYIDDKLIEHCEYNKYGQLQKKTRYYSDYKLYTEFDDQGNKTLFLKMVNETVVGRVTYYHDGSVKEQEELYDDGSIKSIRTYGNDGLPKSEFGYAPNGKMEYQTFFNGGFIDYIDYYYGDEVSVKERVYYSLGFKYESRCYSYDGIYVSKQTYYEEGTARGKIKADYSYNEQGDLILANYYDEKQQLYRERHFTNEGVPTFVINYVNQVMTWREEYDSNGTIVDKYTYHSNGNIKEHYYYKNGTRYQREEFNNKSQLIRLDEYLSTGVGYNRVTKYYPNGNSSVVYTYHDGSVIKQKLEYYETGKLQYDKRYDKTGVITYKFDYDTSGKLVSKRTYSKGEKSRDDLYEDEIRRITLVYNTDGTYTKTYFNTAQTAIRRDYFNKKGQRYKVTSYLKTTKLSGYTTKKVSTCDMATTRQANVVVDIGFDSSYANRDYYAYTNKYGQLIRVDAAQIIRQNETFENVVLGSNGKTSELRYCKTEAQVTDSEDSKYDRGHVLADSMGGAANAYNITPQIEEINLYGAQYLMETMFRQAFVEGKTVTNFSMKISYKNSKTNIPSKYSVSFEIDGEKRSYTANNV